MRPDFPKCLVVAPVHTEPTAADVALLELRAIAERMGFALPVAPTAHDVREVGRMLRAATIPSHVAWTRSARWGGGGL